MASTVILGGGITGLSFYDSLQNKDESIVINKNVELGGYTRTINIDRFRFDYTGHFLHINKFKHPSEIGSLGFKYEKEWNLINKISKVYIDNKLCDAPYQYNFGQLGNEHAIKAIKSFKNRAQQNSDSLLDFFISNFGEYMCEKFFVPYNKKLFGIQLDKLSERQISRFFPNQDEEIIKNQLNKNKNILKTYNSKFWYPRYGGIELLLQHFARPKKSLIAMPKKINLSKKIIYLSDSSQIKYERLISSIPLDNLVQLIDDSEIHDISKSSLDSSSQYAVHIGTSQLIKELIESCWIYIPDPTTDLYRVGNYAFASSFMKGADKGMSLYAEVSGDCENPLDEAINYLHHNFGLDLKLIEVKSINKLNPGYVLFKKNKNIVVNNLLKKLKKESIYSIGRYGSWDYVSMEDCIIQANLLAKTFS